MRTILNCRVMLAGLAVLATVGIAACSAHGAPVSAMPGNGQTASAAASRVATTHAAAPPTVARSATPTASGGIQNLVISSAGLSQLTAAFVAYEGIPLPDVLDASPLPGTVFYAYDPATDTYWALAHFVPSLTAPTNVQEQLNGTTGGPAIAMFREEGKGPWQVELAPVNTAICSYVHFFPPAVSTAWALPVTPPAGQTC